MRASSAPAHASLRPTLFSRGPSQGGSWVSLLLILAFVGGGTHLWQTWHQKQQAEAVRTHAQNGAITMYTTDTCPYCHQAAAWMNEHDIPWKECNLDQDRRCEAGFASQGSPGVPLLNVNGHWKLGFNPQWLERALQTPPVER